MFKKFAIGKVKHQQSLQTAHLHQCLAQVCKPVTFCRMHGLAEPCKTNRLSSRSNGFGNGNVVSNTFVQWLPSCEERKWGRCLGVS
jgi:hypothetical protein